MPLLVVELLELELVAVVVLAPPVPALPVLVVVAGPDPPVLAVVVDVVAEAPPLPLAALVVALAPVEEEAFPDDPQAPSRPSSEVAPRKASERRGRWFILAV